MAVENKEIEDDKEPPLVVVEEQEAEARQAAAREEKEERDDDADETEEVEDERLGKGRGVTEEEVAARGNETDEQRRDRNRRDKVAKKARKQAAIDRSRRELQFLESRNESLEHQIMELRQGHAQTQATVVDGRISQLHEQIRQADQLESQAMAAEAHADVAEVRRIRDQLKDQLNAAQTQKTQIVEKAKQAPQQRQQQRRPDPRVAELSRKFQNDVTWFDPRGGDTDSTVVFAMDVALTQEGSYDPRAPEYWKELKRRVKAALPHRFNVEGQDEDLDDDDDDEESPPPKRRVNTKGGPKMPSGGDRGVKGNNTYYISKERKEALIQAGVWDDPVLRAKYAKKYQKWDELHAARQNRS